jgi:pimeloyl-ACP methyl ester carboxylesterase
MENIEYIKAKIDFLIANTAHYFEAVELKYLELKLKHMQREMWAWFYQQKYDPNQPRRRDGSPQSEQWTEYGVVIPDKSDDLFYVKTIKTPNGKRLNRANVFIGGFNDRDDHKNVLNSNSLQKYTYGDNYYATYDAGKEVIKLINKMPKGSQINLIGHSLGGDTATEIVEAIPNRIHTLITIDPVSHFGSNFRAIRNKAKLWINVNAIGENISGGDAISVFGAWNDLPKNYSNMHLRMRFTHEDFNKMLLYVFDGRNSIQSILNKH